MKFLCGRGLLIGFVAGIVVMVGTTGVRTRGKIAAHNEWLVAECLTEYCLNLEISIL